MIAVQKGNFTPPVGARIARPRKVGFYTNPTVMRNPVGAGFHARPRTVEFCTNRR